jgi:hypothetical protein
MQEKFDGLKEDGEIFADITTATDFVDYCDKADLAIIGADGGMMSEGAFTPDFNLIFDFSDEFASDWQEFKRKCNNRIRSMLESQRNLPESRFYLTFCDRRFIENSRKQ